MGHHAVGGQGAFAVCPIEELYLGRNLIYGTSPFGQVTTLVNVTVGSLVEDVASIDWAKSDGLKTIRLLSMNPPTSHAFTEEQYKNVKLTIPAGSLAAYQEDGVWKNFLNMEEKESTGIGNVETADGKDISVEDGTIVVENAEGNISVYNMAGQLVKSVNANGGRMKMSLPRHGIYIVKAGSLAVKVVL